MSKKNTHRKNLLKIVTFGALAAGFVLASLIVLWISSFKLPDINSLEDIKVSQSTKIYDRTGKVMLYDVHGNIQRTVLPFDKISKNVQNATIAIEDPEFYFHHGIVLKAIIRAVVANITSMGFSQGGSTITQQVVKNTMLTGDKTITRKLKEVVLALRLEQVMNKEQILALYLNEAPYGGSIYGVEEAAETYLGKSATDLDVAEAAYLAAIPNAPTYYSPYGNNRDKLEERKNLVLSKMLENKFISQADYAAALKEKVTFLPQHDTGILAPHFVIFVKQYLEQKYGTQAVENGGLKVITTLDYNLQLQAETILKKWAASNQKNFNASNDSLVAIDPKTGGILAMVGSRDYFDKSIDGNFNVAIAHNRQPGSSFKPFVYATALEKGYTPDTVVFDLPTEFSTYCNPDGTPINPADTEKCYMPVNFDGKYLGPVSFRDALAQSRNIPAIKVLYLAGLRDSLNTAAEMGVTGLGDVSQYGLTLVLGGGEVSLLDMTSAYSVFANEGQRNPYQSILEVDDADGNVLEKFTPSPTEVLPKNIALEITDMLSDNNARAPEFGTNSALNFPGRDVAVKTGTTNDYRDAWIIGYTPSIAVGAWAGNNDNTPMQKQIAGFIVAPMWHEFMDYYLGTTSPEKFDRPDFSAEAGLKPVLRGLWQGNQTYFVDSVSGKLAASSTPPETRIEKSVVQVHSILYWVDKSNPLGPAPSDPTADPQFNLWEYPVRKWATEHGYSDQTGAVIPTAYDNIHGSQWAPRLSIIGVNSGKLYGPTEPVYLMVSGSGQNPLSKVDFFFNDRFIGTSSTYPFSISFVPGSMPNIGPTNTIKAVGYDSIMNRGESSVNINVTAPARPSASSTLLNF